MTKVVLFNGPPQSGKDTLRNYILYDYNAYDVDFKDGIFDAVNWRTLYETVYPDKALYSYEEFKNETNLRQFLIDFSEKVAKPLLGNDIFAKLFCNTIKNHNTDRVNIFYVCADLGFNVELDTCIAEFGLDNILVIQLHRTGCSFDGDSRYYVDTAYRGVKTLLVSNNGDPHDVYVNEIRDSLQRFLYGTTT